MSGTNDEKKPMAAKSYVPPVGPAGHRVLIRGLTARDEYLEPNSPLIIPDDIAEAYENASCIGIVLEIGPNCWKDQPGGKPWCLVGDRVAFTRHAGTRILKGKEFLRVVNDLDVYYVYDRK